MNSIISIVSSSSTTSIITTTTTTTATTTINVCFPLFRLPSCGRGPRATTLTEAPGEDPPCYIIRTHLVV